MTGGAERERRAAGAGAGTGAEGAAGAKRKTRTPHSDVGNNTSHNNTSDEGW